MIHIKDDWYVDVDEASYNLQQYAGVYTDKNGNEIKQWKNQTYHATLDRALWQYVTYKVRDALKERELEVQEAITILQNELQQARKDISNITGGI